MKRSILLAPVAIVMLGLSGCVTPTTPTATTTTSYASELGDQATLKLDEIVVSLPLFGSSETYQNLHLSLAVIINPVGGRTSSPYPSSKSYSFEVENLVRRLGPRINAAVSGALAERKQAQLGNMNSIREQATSTAEGVLTQAMRSWKYAADYNVEVVVMNSYWTDSSVARQSVETTARW